MNIAEDLIRTNKRRFLPALFLTTDKKKLITFECHISNTGFNIEKSDLIEFLSTIDTLFVNLKSKENKITLATLHKLRIKKVNFIENFEVDTTGRENDFLFTYEMKAK